MEMVTVPVGIVLTAFILFLILVFFGLAEYFRRYYGKIAQTHIMAAFLTLTGKVDFKLLKKDGAFVEVPPKLDRSGNVKEGKKGRRYAITEIACYDMKYPPGPLGFLGADIPLAVFHECNVEPLAKRDPSAKESEDKMYIPVEVKKDPHKVYYKDKYGKRVEIIVTPELLAILDKEKVLETMAKVGREMERLQAMASSHINPLVFYIACGILIVGMGVLGYLVFTQQEIIGGLEQGMKAIKAALGVG